MYYSVTSVTKLIIDKFYIVPRPPRNMTIEKTTTNSVIVQWVAPTDSLISEYAIRYRTDYERMWVRLPAVQNTEAEVTDMTPGERYTIQVNTVSYGLESNDPQQLNHTVRKLFNKLLFVVICNLLFFRPKSSIKYSTSG